MLICTLALAAAPEVALVGPTTVEGRVSVGLPPDVARARLADPGWVAEVDQGSTTVQVRSRDGACLVADFTSPSVLTVRYTVRQCPTPQGLRAVLLASDDLDAYDAEWTVTADGAGSLLGYRLHVDTRLPIPDAVVGRSLRKDVLAMLESLARRFPA